MASFLEVPLDTYMLDAIIDNTTLESMRGFNYQYHPFPPEVMDPNHQENLYRTGLW